MRNRRAFLSRRGDLERIKRAVEILAEDALLREYAKDMRHERELRTLAYDGWAEFDKVLDEVQKENEG